jgi:hypothetical protein
MNSFNDKKFSMPQSIDPSVGGKLNYGDIEDYLGDESDLYIVDMGQIDVEERPFMVIDKDSGHIYDIRNDKHV